MTEIKCSKSKCLNNRKGMCTAQSIEYDGLCQTYITHGKAHRNECGLCVRKNGRLHRKGGETLK